MRCVSSVSEAGADTQCIWCIWGPQPVYLRISHLGTELTVAPSKCDTSNTEGCGGMRRDAEGCGGMRWGGSYSRISAPLRVCRAVLVPSARCGACIHPHRLLPPATIPSSTSAMRGDVVSWQDDRGYGFLKRDDGGPDIFVHQSHLMMDGFRTLAIGQRVEFEEMHGERRVEAVRVRVVPEAQPQPQQTRRSAVSLMPRAVARRAAFSSSSASGGKRPAANAAAADAPAPAKRAKPAASTATANKRGVDGTTSSKGGGRPRGEST